MLYNLARLFPYKVLFNTVQQTIIKKLTWAKVVKRYYMLFPISYFFMFNGGVFDVTNLRCCCAVVAEILHKCASNACATRAKGKAPC